MTKKTNDEVNTTDLDEMQLEVPEIPEEHLHGELSEDLVDQDVPTEVHEEEATVGHSVHAEHIEHEETTTGVDQDRITRLIDNIENDLRALRHMLSGTMAPRVDHASRVASAPVGFMQHGEDAGIDGNFDGERMVDAEGKGYQVPPNYASKSKLVEGDPLKLYITGDGKYVFKQLGPVDRTTVPGTLRMEGNHYVVDADDGNVYNILTACVTYYMSLYGLEPDGRIMAMIPTSHAPRWAVIDNIL
jgi:hypothetical protein